MTVYKVPHRSIPGRDEDDGHNGYYWTTSKSDADRNFKENGGDTERGDKVLKIELAMNKSDLIAFLNAYCSWPDNG